MGDATGGAKFLAQNSNVQTHFWVKLFSPPNVIQRDAANLPLGVITSPVVERLERKRIFKARHDMNFFHETIARRSQLVVESPSLS